MGTKLHVPILSLSLSLSHTHTHTPSSPHRKKLSKFVQHPDWNNASNYVAKCYMKEAPRDVYFEDVKLQMDSKLWGEKYNQLAVPKKVCVCVYVCFCFLEHNIIGRVHFEILNLANASLRH